jgi:hypothetical protein
MEMLMEYARRQTSAPPQIPPGTVYYDEWFGASVAGANVALSAVNQIATLRPEQSYAIGTYPAQNAWIEPFLVNPNQLERTPSPPKPSEAAARDAQELGIIEQYLLGAP